MIAGCPTCAARYRIDTAKLRPDGARLRCSRCETVFRVRPPAEEAVAPSAPPVQDDTAPSTSSPAPSSQQPVPTHPVARPPTPAADPAKLVLVAHADAAVGKALADAIAGWGLVPLLVHDGVEAILNVQRSLPRVVVLDAALPKMFGFQVCELMKRNEQLRSIPVVLIGAIHDRDRYRRPPEELYGADAYVESHELPDALADHLAGFGLASGVPSPTVDPAPGVTDSPERSVDEAASTAQPPPEPSPEVAAPTPPTTPAPAPEPVAAEAPADDPELEKGSRLARIIVSDVILYNPEQFEAGIRGGNVLEALHAELQEGYKLFAQRVDTKVCDPEVFLQRELMRVAKSRGMQG